MTMTIPLLFNQANITCAGVAPSLAPIFLSTGSTGPPGFLVIGLKKELENKGGERDRSSPRTCHL